MTLMMPLVSIDNLTVAFGPINRPIHAVRDANLSLGRGEIVGIAGESGSGKTTLCSALIGALPGAARKSGAIKFEGRDLARLSPREMRDLRGREISMILQNPMTSLDPLFTVGDQLREVLRRGGAIPKADLRHRALALLRAVHLSAPDARLGQYPHELSGGMRQRVLTAMATANSPKLLIADEPTTALDATIQEEILILFREIRDLAGTTVVIVTHDLGVIRRVCERVVIMYAGRIVEEGPVASVFENPLHPYTQALIDSIPVISQGEVRLAAIDGQTPDLTNLGPGCAFADRCIEASERCAREAPPEVRRTARRVFCWNREAADV